MRVLLMNNPIWDELLRISCSQSPVYVHKVEGLKWYEIDDISDLEYAEKYIVPYC